MKQNPDQSRRDFLKTSIGLPAALAVSATGAGIYGTHSLEASTAERTLPRRKLGKNGPDVTILNIGGMMSAHNPQFLDIAWKLGIRYFDTADCYKGGQSERDIASWLKKYPERRQDLFLVTKDHPEDSPDELLTMIDERLEQLQTDYVDLLFVHGMSPDYGGGLSESLSWLKPGSRLNEVFDEIKASGKARMLGFSCHDKYLLDYLNAAAESGFVDAIMLKHNPFAEKGGEFDQAVEACYQAGIGLISMKEMKPFAKAPKNNPALEEVGLTTHQALLHAVWSDERFASICSAMENIQELDENTLAASTYQAPLPGKQREALAEIAGMMPVPMCPGCPGCDAQRNHVEFAYYDISRYLTYYEQDGRAEAREKYRRLSPSARQALPGQLEALRAACQFNVDYPEIARRAEAYFA